MKTMNINLKIEAKKSAMFGTIKPQTETLKYLKSLYDVFTKDLFLLPYKVQKLSKRAKRNLI